MHLSPFFAFASFFCILSGVQGQASPSTTHNGTMFLFNPGAGACGFTNTSSQTVASVSAPVFKSFPGAGPNPNKNPICHHKALITYNGKSVTAQIVDYFTDPGQPNNIGLSPPGFTTFGPESDGLVPSVTWTIV